MFHIIFSLNVLHHYYHNKLKIILPHLQPLRRQGRRRSVGSCSLLRFLFFTKNCGVWGAAPVPASAEKAFTQ
jgi:hypothetical protein